MNDSSDILRRVRALLAKAEAEGTTPAEAEALSAKAEELITRYAIDAALLDASTEAHKRERPTVRTVPVPNPYSRPKRILLDRIGQAFSVQCISYTPRHGDAYCKLVGFPSDLDAVELLYDSLVLQAISAMLAEYVPSWENTTSFRTSFLYAFATRVHKRVQENRRKATAESGGPSTEIVLRDRTSEVDAYVRVEFPHLRRTRGGGSSRRGRDAGDAAGRRADIGQSRLGGARVSITR